MKVLGHIGANATKGSGNLKNSSYYLERQEKFESNARSYPRKFPVVIKKAKGVTITDVDGKEYLDFLCGAGTLALGHNDSEVQNALIEMIKSDYPMHTLDLDTPIKDEFMQTIIDHLPSGLKENAKIQFCSPAGTDAADAAIKLCKVATGRKSIISFSHAYHGMGQGPLSLMGNLHAKEYIPEMMGEVHFMPYPYSYRCPFGLGGEKGAKAASWFFEHTLKDPESGIAKPAAVILEPIQGEGGVIPAPVEFLQTVRRVTEELDIPLIVDEVQCGIGRSGKFFAFEYANIVPDVIMMSKATGGSLPMAVIVYNKKLDKWTPGTHAGTFRGNQMAMKAGTITMNRVGDKKFLAEVVRKGNHFINSMKSLQKEVSIIGEVRGKGLMAGVELIDPNSKPDALGAKKASGEIGALVQKKCFENGLIMEKGGNYGSVLRCLTALNISDEELNKGIAIISKVIREVDEQYKKR